MKISPIKNRALASHNHLVRRTLNNVYKACWQTHSLKLRVDLFLIDGAFLCEISILTTWDTPTSEIQLLMNLKANEETQKIYLNLPQCASIDVIINQDFFNSLYYDIDWPSKTAHVEANAIINIPEDPDAFYESLDDCMCCSCGDPCGDADLLNGRDDNCVMCYPCFLCTECAVSLPNGKRVCMLCLDPSDMNLVLSQFDDSHNRIKLERRYMFVQRLQL